MNKCKYFLTIIIAAFSFPTILNAQLPAFPSAEGGGMFTSGGRGGKVLYVTSLADDGSVGTFRWAVSQKEPRTVLFKVSGTISLIKPLTVKYGNLTIAGQSAPGDGICLKDNDVFFSADNVIVRFLRFRLGDLVKDHDPDAYGGRNRKNIIIDHCSSSWSIDECASFYSNENFTLQWCIVAESLNNSEHPKGAHGYGGIWGGKNASFHHNLIAHNNSRNPRFNGLRRSGLKYNNAMDEERVDFCNNVIYNWGDHSSYGGESGLFNIVGNYFKSGPATKLNLRNRITNIDMDIDPKICPPGYGKYFIKDNFVFGFPDVTTDNWKGVSYSDGVNKMDCKVNKPFTTTPVKIHPAPAAYQKVLATAGASFQRDVVDARIVNEVKTGTATYKGSLSGREGLIDTQSDVGGWPEYKSVPAPTDSNDDGIPDGWLESKYPNKNANDIDKSGYTYLEIYLNSLVKSITDSQL